MRSRLPWARRRLPIDPSALDPAGFGPWPVGGVLVGGAVRDALLGREPADLDWAVTDPRRACEELAIAQGGSCFPLDVERGHWRSIGRRGTADFVRLDGDVEDDLVRRDLTINAMALRQSGALVDPSGGLRDLQDGIVRMTSRESLMADPVRPLRAVRFAAELVFELEPATESAVAHAATGLRDGTFEPPAPERARDELTAMLLSEGAARGVVVAHRTGLLAALLPELSANEGLVQGQLHHRDVLWHSIEALDVLVRTFPDAPLDVRLGTLLHDVGKAVTVTHELPSRPSFHAHDARGAELTAAALRRLRFDSRTVGRATELVRRHMAPLPRSERAARRFVHRHREHLPGLLQLMVADREAARGRAAGSAGRVRYRIAVSRVLAVLQEPDPPSPLLTGEEVMALLGIGPGPAVGEALALVSEARAVGDVVDAESARELLLRYFAAKDSSARR